ncbi:bifunctional glycosyltransferase/class I SAM-dependent methyltransferase [Pelagibacteraceae bacterium]|nr:bifunctional glycosyltransferase/class I SAM-dependent methyltransferase [Pelagibacteraceae bacterium]
MKKKLLVLIVAYNHEKFIKSVLDRIDDNLFKTYEVEVLINDDSSTDNTLNITKDYIKNNTNKKIKYTVLSNPVNQGYGGNQKIGFLYAIKNNFDFVALVHGDGQYAPEYLETLIKPLNDENTDAVFGSRMINKNGAIKGGMPFYKYIGNKILTFYQNKLFNKNFTEFHSGYRIYKVQSLKKIPYELNNNDHSFDNEIIIQLLIANLNIKELPIPTYYGDEISYVNGFRYAFQVFIANAKAKVQKYGIFYDRKYNFKSENYDNYKLKEKFDSPHKRALDRIKEGSYVLDIGCHSTKLAKILNDTKNCKITAIDKSEKLENSSFIEKYFSFDLDNGLPDLDYNKFDYILLLDVIEHLKNPEEFMTRLKQKTEKNQNLKIITSTGNVGFLIIRLMLLFGSFNYGHRGILDKTHTRLFTFSSFRNLMVQAGFNIKRISGVPAPIPFVIGNNVLSKFLLNINKFFILISKEIFAYQIYLEIKPQISINLLLDQAKSKAHNEE